MTTYFSINDANKILPTVIKKFNYTKTLKNEIIKMEQQMSVELTPKTSMEEYKIRKQKFNAIIVIYNINEKDEKCTCYPFWRCWE